jgi:hypothetical protein
MLPTEGSLFGVGVHRVSVSLARVFLKKHGFVSIVGHDSTANILACMLDLTVPVNRVSIQLQDGDTLVVAQYNGPRLKEGETVLPPGATIDFMVVLPKVVTEGAPWSIVCREA